MHKHQLVICQFMLSLHATFCQIQVRTKNPLVIHNCFIMMYFCGEVLQRYPLRGKRLCMFHERLHKHKCHKQKVHAVLSHVCVCVLSKALTIISTLISSS